MGDKGKKLVVIDGKSVFYRGYYAMPNLSTPEGKPTGGVYGFAILALQILKKLEPDYVIVAWDKSKTNLRARRKLYEQYKANRKPMPEDMREQIPLLRELLGGFNWPLLECDDFEADDIMATLTRLAAKKGIYTTLVTSDLDILQAINGTSDVFLLKHGLTNVVQMDRKAFEAEYGMSVEQFIDYKALKGDSSDNVPGVRGVGDKTAKELIKQYGTLEGVYKSLAKIPEKLRAKLEADKDMAYLSHKLLEIKFNAPVKLDLKHADVQKANPAEIAELFERLQFKRLIAELPKQMKAQAAMSLEAASPAEPPAKLDVSVEEITEPSALKKLKLPQKLVFYTVTELDKERQLPKAKELVISPTKHTAYLVKGRALEAVPSIMSGRQLIGFDLKTDLKAWAQFSKVDVYDLQVLGFILNPLRRHKGLFDISKEELGMDLTVLDGSAESIELNEVSAGMLAGSLWQLHVHYNQQLAKTPKLKKVATEIDFPVIPVLAEMEYTGIELDTKYLEQISKELAKRIDEIQSLIYREAKEEFNISSPAQLQTVLFQTLGLPTQGIKKTQGGYSTAANELDKLRGLHPIINLISEYRELTKLKSTYVDTLPKQVDQSSRLHTVFNMTMAQTGRLSSENPNLQNIPIRTDVGKEIRKAFVAGKGKVLVSADYSQFELRLAAVLSGDTNMIHAFNKGIDIHAMTAAEVYDLDDIDMVTKNQRRDAKVVNFGVLYGMSPHGLSVATGMSRDQAQKFIDRYFKLRAPLLNYMESLKEKARKDGYVETMFGRRRPMPDIKSSNFMVRAAAERAAINMPAQGTEADLMKIAMVEVAKKLDPDCKQLLQIHDSILVEVPKAKAERVAKLLKSTMESVHKLPVKLEVDVEIGANWGDL